MTIARRMRVLLLASASVAALWVGSMEAQAADLAPQPAEPLPPVDARGVISLTAMGYGFWQADQGVGFTPLGSIDPLVGLGGGLGIAYQPALSPWSFGLNARYGTTSKKSKSVAFTSSPSTSGILTEKRKSSHFIVDFTVGRDLGLGLTPAGDPVLQLQGGLRFAHLEDKTDIQAVVTFGPPSSSGASVKRSFTGFGPRIGLAGSMPLGGAFSLDGTGGVSLLYGRSTEKVTLTSSGSVTFVAKKNKNAWVPGLDGSVAVSYSFNPSAKISAGYRAEAYFNAYSAVVPGGGGVTQDKDFIVHGPYVEAKFKF